MRLIVMSVRKVTCPLELEESITVVLNSMECARRRNLTVMAASLANNASLTCPPIGIPMPSPPILLLVVKACCIPRESFRKKLHFKYGLACKNYRNKSEMKKHTRRLPCFGTMPEKKDKKDYPISAVCHAFPSSFRIG